MPEEEQNVRMSQAEFAAILTHAYVCLIILGAMKWTVSWRDGFREVGMEKDRRGRRRQPDQERGLRPLYPPLPGEWTSKAVRVAMSAEDWARFDALVQNAAPSAPTQARAQGMVISHLLERSDAEARPAPGPFDWMDWERQKTLKLLRSAV